MKNSIKTVFITLLLMGGLIAQEETVTNEATNTTEEGTLKVHGEMSTDFTFGDVNSFTSPYMGLVFSGDDFVLSTNLSEGMVNIEEAKYMWNIVDGVTMSFGSQAEPFGLAWGLHRPSNNWFVSMPREHSIMNGIGVGVDKWGVGFDFLLGGGEEDYWAGRMSYGLSLLGINSEIGLSLNSNDAQLIDVSMENNFFETSLEYDLSEEADGAYWLRGVITPPQTLGAFFLVGYDSNEEVLYGVGYKCSDNFKFSSEFSTEDGDDSDIVIRASYSF